MAAERDYYEVLGVERGAVDADDQARLPQAGPAVAPDVNTEPDGADERFKEINEAYQVLSDPQRRQAYDMFGHAGVGGNGAARRGYGGRSVASEASATSSMPSSAAPHGRCAARARPAGADLRYDLRITFDEAVLGAEKEIEFPVLGRCDTCGGSGAKPGLAARSSAPSATAAARSARSARRCSARWST